MKNGWTGGQYSLWRIWAGLSVGAFFAVSLRAAPDALTLGAASAGILSAILVLLGWRDRWAALLCAGLGLHLLSSTDQLRALWLVLALVIHASSPRAPYGSLEARGRPDPGGGWQLTDRHYAFVWIAFVFAHSVETALLVLLDFDTVYDQIAIAGTALLVVLALLPRTRPVAWLLGWLLIAMRATLMQDGELLWLWLLHGLAFDPGWIGPMRVAEKDRIFYDSHCGLCHRAVRFALAEDRNDAFVYSPLEGQAFSRVVNESDRESLPDSIVLLTADGRLLMRSQAVLRMMERLGGGWRVAALVMRAVPRPLRDWAYDAVARVRKRIFRAPPDLCPVLPPKLRERFED